MHACFYRQAGSPTLGTRRSQRVLPHMMRSSEGLQAALSAERPARSARDGETIPAAEEPPLDISCKVIRRAWVVTSKMKAWRGVLLEQLTPDTCRCGSVGV